MAVPQGAMLRWLLDGSAEAAKAGCHPSPSVYPSDAPTHTRAGFVHFQPSPAPNYSLERGRLTASLLALPTPATEVFHHIILTPKHPKTPR